MGRGRASGSGSGAKVDLHGMQPTGCMDIDPVPSRGEPCLGLPRKNDQFQLDRTQS